MTSPSPIRANRLLAFFTRGDLTLGFFVPYLLLFLITAAWAFSLTHRGIILYQSSSSAGKMRSVQADLFQGRLTLRTGSWDLAIDHSSWYSSLERKPFDSSWWFEWKNDPTSPGPTLTIPLWAILVPILVVLWMSVLKRIRKRASAQAPVVEPA